MKEADSRGERVHALGILETWFSTQIKSKWKDTVGSVETERVALFHLTNPPLQKFVQQHSEEYGDGFSIEIYGTLDAETKEKFSATGFPIKYFDTRLGYSRYRK